MPKPTPPNSVSRRRFLTLGASTLVLAACNDSSSSAALPPATETPGTTPDPEPPTPDPVDPIPPRGLHASLTDNVHESRTVTWFTDGDTAPQSYIEYGSVTPGMDESALQNEPFPSRADASADPTTGIEAFTHRARADVADNTLALRYRVGSDEHGWSPVYVIQPSPTEEWSFIHFGDHGVHALPQMVTAEIEKTPADLLLIAGDLSYANGDQPIWDLWFEQMEPLLATRPMLAAPGNHEEKDFGGDTFKNRFTHPPKPLTSILTGNNPGSSFYAFDYNRIHFLVTTAGALINDGTLPEELLNIEADLALAAARRAAGEIDFIAVMQHFPIWTDQLGRSPANPALVLLEENIIVRYGVDLLLVGHDHIYQRSAPMSFGIPNPLGYVQVMVGTGGQSVRLLDDNGPQIWSEAEFIGIGFARYHVSPGLIRVEYFGSPPHGLSDEERQLNDGVFSVQDSFEVRSRDLFACRECVLPPRGIRELEQLRQEFEGYVGDRLPHSGAHC